jgi:hypothetical protein
MKKIYSLFALPLFLLLVNPSSGQAQLNASTTSTNCTCPGACNGTATVTASSGTPPYTYSWSPTGGTSATATSLCAGSYTVKVTDNIGTTLNKTVVITQPTGITIGLTPSNVSCNGANDGSIYASTSGGTGPYTYSWSPSGGTSQTASSLAPGAYTIHVTDSKGCTANQTGTITQPAVLTVSMTPTNVTCYGSGNGTARATPAGGNGSFTYSWTGGTITSGQGTATASGLAPGTYTCKVNDSRLCTSSGVVTITQPSAITTTITQQTQTTCYQTANGSATVAPSGGTGAYTYSWSPKGGTAATGVGLSNGSYTCFVTDANGCNANPTNVPMSQPSAVTAYISTQTNVLCKGGSTGAATAQASGGTGAFTFSWSPTGSNTATTNGLIAGNYTCNITDANACPASVIATITENAQDSMYGTSSAANCGSANGSATVNTVFGNSPWTFSWKAPVSSTTNTASSLSAGIYTVKVTNTYGCIRTFNITVSNIGAPTATVNVTNNACKGLSNGTATVAASGGTGAYTYSWAPIAGTTATVSGLAAGTYTSYVKDASGCMVITTTTLTDPPTLTGTVTAFNLACNGSSTGTATMTASGGTPNYLYSWSPSGGTGSTANSLAAGTYTCITTDSKGCTYSATTTLTQPTAIAPNFTTKGPSCAGINDGSATTNPTGGTPGFSYSWNGTNNTTNTLTGLPAGAYNCTLTDTNGCTATFVVNIYSPAPVSGSVSTSNVSCFGSCDGTATFTLSGGTAPYTYAWSPTGGSATTGTNLCAGSYTCFANDAHNCATQTSVSITQPLALSVAVSATNASCGGICDGTVSATATGGTPFYLYSWTKSGQPISSTTKLCPATYTCLVTDSRSCTQSSTVTLSSSVSPIISGSVTAKISGVVNSGWVYLVRYDTVLKRQHVIDSVTISNGHYSFNNSTAGPFLVFAQANKITYPKVVKTYSPKAAMWDSAAVILAPCGSIDTANIQMQEFNALAGIGSLTGLIVKGSGYVSRYIGGSNPGTHKPGDPIPGLDVNLEQRPGGIIYHTLTDSTGNYHFSGVPNGQYSVLVDIPGLGMVSQYTRTISATNPKFTNLNYLVDSAHIRPDSAIAQGIIQNTRPEPALRLSPNPFKDQLTVQYTLNEASDVTMELFNILGERILLSSKGRQDAGQHSYVLSGAENGFSQGTYIFKITMNGTVYTGKVVCMP